MAKWKVELQCDIIKGQFNTLFWTFIYHEFYYILAKNSNLFYIHYTIFDNWEGANKLVNRIRKVLDFTPENKPLLWKKIMDVKSVRPKRYRKKIVYDY